MTRLCVCAWRVRESDRERGRESERERERESERERERQRKRKRERDREIWMKSVRARKLQRRPTSIARRSLQPKKSKAKAKPKPGQPLQDSEDEGQSWETDAEACA